MLLPAGAILPQIACARRLIAAQSESASRGTPSSVAYKRRSAMRSRRRSPCPSSGVVALPPRSGVRGAPRPRARARSRARSPRAASAMPEMLEHQRARPDLADRIGDALARDVRRGAVDRLEQRRKRALGIDVRRRRDADGAAHRRPEVGQNVAEQVRADDDVEATRAAARSARSECRCGTGRCGCRDSAAAIARKRSSQYGMVIEMPFDLVAEVTCFAGRLPRQLEGEAQDAVHALAREHRLLEHDLALGALEHAPADRRVLAFGIFAHDDEIDVAGLAVRRAATGCPASAGTAAG